MKKWLNSIKLIVLLILTVGFIGYVYINKYLNKDKEGFQTSVGNDYHFPHFDISGNYYDYSSYEKNGSVTPNPDVGILSVGTTEGAIDLKSIPWDSENLDLNPSDVLWGCVPIEASTNLYFKVFVAQQLAQLKVEEDAKVHYESAILHYGTTDPLIGLGIESADFIANFISPLVLPMASTALNEAIFNVTASEAEKIAHAAKAEIKQKNIINSLQSIGWIKKNQGETPLKETTEDKMAKTTEKREMTKRKFEQIRNTNLPPKYRFDKNGKELPKIKKSITKLVASKSKTIMKSLLRLTGKMFVIIFDWLELLPDIGTFPTSYWANFVYMTVIMPIIMSLAMPLQAPRSGADPKITGEIVGVGLSLVAMSVTAGAALVIGTAAAADVEPTTKAALEVQARFWNWAMLSAALAGALTAFFEQRDAVPKNYRSVMQGMMEQTGHGAGDGKCPSGYLAVNEIVNPTLEIFVSFVPIIGDLFDLMYPYTCVKNDFMTNHNGNLVVLRDPYITPKYLEQSWISAKFIDFPDYNGKYSAQAAISQAGATLYHPKSVSGKKRNVPNTLERTFSSLYDWNNYTNLMDIAYDPNSYFNVDVELDEFNQKLTFKYLDGSTSKDTPNPPNDFRFFYLDFTEPSILVEMAQFYYNNAIKNPFPNDDGSVSVTYISKINYVTASSLFTCDCMCEMTTVRYNPVTSQIISQQLSFDSDRRFYFRWTPDTTKPTGSNDPNTGYPIYYGKPLTRIWGNSRSNSYNFNKTNSNWMDLEDAWDDAMYQLEDTIHFPNDPAANATGLIDGTLLLSAYEQYLEKKERSDYAREYIYQQYTATPELRAKYPDLISAYTNFSNISTTLGTARITTGELSQNIAYSDANKAQYINSNNTYNAAVAAVQPFFGDLLANTCNATSNYVNTLGKLYRNNENPLLFLKDDLDFNTDPITNDLQTKMDAVITARSTFYGQHLLDRPSLYNYDLQCSNFYTDYRINPNGQQPTQEQSNFYVTKYYDVVGCTYIDGAAHEAVDPDIANEESDIRFPVKIDVIPYLRRCPFVNIITETCIDLSNVELVIQSYSNLYPTKRIKSIQSMKAQANNICQYVWDEYDTANPSVITRTSNRILYQMNLSSCMFCLPTDPATNKTVLFVDNLNPLNSHIATPPIDSQVSLFGGPVNGNTLLPNPNPIIKPLEAYYLKPIGGSAVTKPTSFTYTTVDYNTTVPRYDPNNYSVLPELIRPKKPIRVIYPNGPQSNLANEANNFCSDPINLSNFMLKYNQDSNNHEKILNVQRAFTTGVNTCDMEVDVLIPTPPNKADGSPYLSFAFSDIVSFNSDDTFTVATTTTPTGFYKDMIVNVVINNIIPTYINYHLTTDDKDANGDYLEASIHSEPYTPYSTDTTRKEIYQALQGNRKITNVDLTNKKIKLQFDTSRYPTDLDSSTIAKHTTTLFGLSRTDSYPGNARLLFTVARRTVSTTLTSAPTNGSLTEPFTNTPFTYNTLSSGPNQGLKINVHTSTLMGSYSNTGFQFNKPVADHTNMIFGPNTNYFNNYLVSNYTSTMSNVKQSSKDFLAATYLTNVHLSNAGVNTGIRCDDLSIMQRIMDAYNNISTPTGLFNQEQNTMIQIVQASTDIDNNCHIIFENKNELYNDYIYSYPKDSNNYTATNTLMFKRFPVTYDTTLASFKPDRTSINFNSTLEAADIALSLGTNLNTYYRSQRPETICQITETIVTSLTPTLVAIIQGLGHQVVEQIKHTIITYDTVDYIMSIRMKPNNSTILTSPIKLIVRAKFTLADYNPATNFCSWNYSSFIIQMVAPTDTTLKNNLTYSYVQFIDTIPANFRGKDNISRLFMDPEYTGVRPSDATGRLS